MLDQASLRLLVWQYLSGPGTTGHCQGPADDPKKLLTPECQSVNANTTEENGSASDQKTNNFRLQLATECTQLIAQPLHHLNESTGFVWQVPMEAAFVALWGQLAFLGWLHKKRQTISNTSTTMSCCVLRGLR